MNNHNNYLLTLAVFFISGLLLTNPVSAIVIPAEWAPPGPNEVIMTDPGPFSPVITPSSSPWIKTVETGVAPNGTPITWETYLAEPMGKPKGLVVFLHGTSGSASYITRTEEQSVVNKLLAAGYAVVATDSYSRGGENHWDVTLDSSNKDFPRIATLRQKFLNRNGLDNDTPWFAWGFSFGGASTYGMAHMAEQAGIPMSAIANYSGPGDLSNSLLPRPINTPVFLSVGENDVVIKSDGVNHRANDIANDLNLLINDGTEVEFHLGLEKLLVAERFLRIEGVDQMLAESIYDILLDKNIIDTNGKRLIRLDEDGSNTFDRQDLADLLTWQPSNINDPLNPLTAISVGTYWENTPWKLGRLVNQQLSAVWAQHLLTGEFGTQQVAFFQKYTSVSEPSTLSLLFTLAFMFTVFKNKKTA